MPYFYVNKLTLIEKTMIPSQLNIALIEAIKEKTSADVNLANLLTDILFLGKEAIYRRLRGDVPFTLAEAATICKRIGLSLDQIIGASFNNSAVFDLNIIPKVGP